MLRKVLVVAGAVGLGLTALSVAYTGGYADGKHDGGIIAFGKTAAELNYEASDETLLDKFDYAFRSTIAMAAKGKVF